MLRQRVLKQEAPQQRRKPPRESPPVMARSASRTLGRMDAVEPDQGDDPPLTADTLADLQAGLLDDETAARVRQRVRADPGARQTMEALNRVRRDVAVLGSDAASAPPVDPALVDGIVAGLRAQPAGAAHAVRRGRLPRP